MGAAGTTGEGHVIRRAVGLGVALVSLAVPVSAANAQSMTDSRLAVRTAVQGLSGPTSMAFLGSDDMLVLEKATAG
jgi:hypothetical protein